ncbi:MAG: hypothetical protein ABSA54_12215 [Terriglobales bacterium]|jgi:hypothetical protein
MADDQIRDTVLPAPYLPFKTFLSSLDPFTQGVPPKIDRSLWNQSGFVQGLIMNAYRFFHLVDVNSKPSPEFQRLVKSKDQARKEEIKKLLAIGYPEVMTHDLATMTPKMLDEQIERYNVSGDTKKKAATFFLQAAKFAEIPLSNFLTEKIRNTSGTKRRRRAEGETDSRIPKPPSINSSSGSSRSVTLADGGTITLAISVDVFSLGKEDREFVFGLIDQLQTYEADHSSDDGEQDEGQV